MSMQSVGCTPRCFTDAAVAPMLFMGCSSDCTGSGGCCRSISVMLLLVHSSRSYPIANSGGIIYFTSMLISKIKLRL